MAVTFVQGKYNRVGGATQALVFTSGTTLGSILFCCIVSETSLTTPVISDSIGNTWVQIGTLVTGASATAALYFAINKNSGADTVTCGFTGGGVAVGAIWEYTGQSAVSPVDPATTLAYTSSAGSPLIYSFPTIVTGSANEQVILLMIDYKANGSETDNVTGYAGQFFSNANNLCRILDQFFPISGTSSGTNTISFVGGAANFAIAATIAIKSAASAGGGRNGSWLSVALNNGLRGVRH
jgi:hypothetical protein